MRISTSFPFVFRMGPALLVRWSLCFAVVCVAPLPSAQVKAPQDAAQVLDIFNTALQEGDVDVLLDGATGRIDMFLVGRGDHYSPGQARHVLRHFFLTYPADRASLASSRASAEQISFTGRYWFEGSDESMNVSLVVRTNAVGKATLESLRISPLTNR